MMDTTPLKNLGKPHKNPTYELQDQSFYYRSGLIIDWVIKGAFHFGYVSQRYMNTSFMSELSCICLYHMNYGLLFGIEFNTLAVGQPFNYAFSYAV